jgi:hemin uptake protein HemP
MQLRVICIKSWKQSTKSLRVIMHASPPAPPPQPISVLRRIASGELMAGQHEIIILHDGQEYRLRITSAGKLILTK